MLIGALPTLRVCRIGVQEHQPACKEKENAHGCVLHIRYSGGGGSREDGEVPRGRSADRGEVRRSVSGARWPLRCGGGRLAAAVSCDHRVSEPGAGAPLVSL